MKLLFESVIVHVKKKPAVLYGISSLNAEQEEN